MQIQRTLILFTLLLTSIGIAQAAVQITSQPITDGLVGEQYTYQVTTNEPNTAYGVDGPTGMTISTQGEITWNPSSTGTYDVTVQATNQSNTSDNTTQSYTLTIRDPAPGQFQAGPVEIGDDDTERDRSYQATYTVQNTGDQDITSFNATSSNIDTDYEFSATNAPTTIPSGASRDITIDYFVPEEQDSGRERIGSLQLSGTTDGQSISVTRDVFITAKTGLEFEEVEVSVDGDDDTVDDGDEVDEEAEVGDEIEIVVTLENVLEDTDIEDIEVRTTADDLDPADDLEEEIDIDAGDDEDVTFTFTLDPREIDFDDAPFTVELEAEGEDENGATHTANFEFDLDVDQEDEDLRFADDNLNGEVLQCNLNSVEFDFEIINVGSDDLEEAMIEYDSPELDIGEFDRGLEIDEGDAEDIQKRFTFNDRPSDGTYYIDVTLYTERSTNADTDSSTLRLDVPQCGQTEEQEETEEEMVDEDGDGTSIDVDRGDQGSTNGGTTSQPVVIGSGEETSSDEAIYVLGALVAVLIITVGWVFTKVVA